MESALCGIGARICFCISLIRQQLVRKYRTHVLSRQYSTWKVFFQLHVIQFEALCGLVLFFKRCFLFTFTGSQHFITRQNLNQISSNKQVLFNFAMDRLALACTIQKRFNILGSVRYAFRNNEMKGLKIQSCSSSQIHFVLVDELPTEHVQGNSPKKVEKWKRAVRKSN